MPDHLRISLSGRDVSRGRMVWNKKSDSMCSVSGQPSINIHIHMLTDYVEYWHISKREFGEVILSFCIGSCLLC